MIKDQGSRIKGVPLDFEEKSSPAKNHQKGSKMCDFVDFSFFLLC